MGNRKHLVVDYETYDLVMKDCIKEFLDQHPEMRGMKLSQNFIIRQIALEYVNEKVEHY